MTSRRGMRMVALMACLGLGAAVPRPMASQAVTALPTMHPGFVAETWTTEAGLPVNGVTSVTQARSGYIWLTTFDGIVRFDGIRFTVFRTGNTPVLPTSRFVQVLEGPDGLLWFQSEFGQLITLGPNGFERVDRERGMVGDVAWALLPADDSTMAVATAQALHLYTRGRVRAVARTEQPLLGNPGFWSDRTLSAAPDGTRFAVVGRVVHRAGPGEPARRVALPVAVSRTLVLFPFSRDSFLVGTQDGLHLVSGGVVTAMAPREPILRIDRGRVTGRLLVTTAQGVHALEDGGAALVAAVADSIDTPLVEAVDGAVWYAADGVLFRNAEAIFRAPGWVRGLATDREGSVWLSSDNGLHRVQPARAVSVSPRGVSERSTYPILEMQDSSILMGFMRGGMARFQNGEFTANESVPAVGGGIVLAFHEDPDGALWVGGWHGACRWAPPGCDYPTNDPAFRSRRVRAIHRDRSGVMWFGSETGLFRWDSTRFDRFTRDDGLPSDWVRAITEARDGTLWFATNGGGIFSYRDRQFHTIGVAEGISSPNVRAIHEDDRGVLWIGTEGRGINRLQPDPSEPSGYRIDAIRAADGLFDDGVHQILEDGHGRMWMSSNRGIFWVYRDSLDALANGRIPTVHSVSYQERDGMRNREANGGVNHAGIRASDGRLWFPTVDGAVVFDPASVQGNTLPPPVAIERVLWSGEAAPVRADTVRLAPTQREFEIEYTGLSLLAPQQVRFRYRLEGFHERWVDAGARRTAFFTNVPPGRYQFRVVASNNDGVWNEEGATLAVVVAPYFYETAVFRGGLAALLIGAIGLTVRARMAGHVRRQEELGHLVEIRTADAERHRTTAEEALAVVAQQAERLQRLDAAKTRFFSDVSHEFRTPLTLILGPLEDLKDGRRGTLGPEAAAEVEIAIRNARRLVKLVNELLDITKIDAGEMKLSAAPGDLWAAVASVTEAFIPLAERREVDLRIEQPADPCIVYFDATLVERIVGNLLSNSLKFTPAGGVVRLRMARVPHGEWGHAAEIEVRDSGRGIPAEDLPYVFERFRQASGHEDHPQLGTGIGLSLTRELVLLHGGRILVESQEGFGTVFRVLLRLGSSHLAPDQIARGHRPPADPAAPVEDADAAASPETEPDDARGDRPVVLVADDNADVRAYVRRHLAAEYLVLEAASGHQAIGMAREREPDLVLCDLMMPESGGLDVIRALRSDRTTDFIPVVLLTAQASDDRRIEGLAAGADDYLTKPFSMHELLARVRNLIESRRRLRSRFRSFATPEAGDDPADPFLAQLRHTVLEHIEDDDFGVEQLAHALALSRSHLYRKVHQVTGRSAADLLRRIRLDRAHALLRAGAGNVSEIAYAVGFKSLSHFSRSFRSEFGVAPSAVRAAAGRDPSDPD